MCGPYPRDARARYRGKHKQVYDLMWHTLRPNTLNPPMFYFNVLKEVSQLEYPDVNVVVGVYVAHKASEALIAKLVFSSTSHSAVRSTASQERESILR